MSSETGIFFASGHFFGIEFVIGSHQWINQKRSMYMLFLYLQNFKWGFVNNLVLLDWWSPSDLSISVWHIAHHVESFSVLVLFQFRAEVVMRVCWSFHHRLPISYLYRASTIQIGENVYNWESHNMQRYIHLATFPFQFFPFSCILTFSSTR
jgi:hypothetical protein